MSNLTKNQILAIVLLAVVIMVGTIILLTTADSGDGDDLIPTETPTTGWIVPATDGWL